MEGDIYSVAGPNLLLEDSMKKDYFPIGMKRFHDKLQ